jgi:hypothetical protein
METAGSSQTMVPIYQTTWHHITENHNLRTKLETYSYTLEAYIQLHFRLNRFKVLGVVTMRNTVFWDMALCSMAEIYRGFRKTYCLYLQDQRICYSACLTYSSTLKMEAVQNVGKLLSEYRVSHPRR